MSWGPTRFALARRLRWAAVAGTLLAASVFGFAALAEDEFRSEFTVFAQPGLLGLSGGDEAPAGGLVEFARDVEAEAAHLISEPVRQDVARAEPKAIPYLRRVTVHNDEGNRLVVRVVTTRENEARVLANRFALVALEVRRSDRAKQVLRALNVVDERLVRIDRQLAVAGSEEPPSASESPSVIGLDPSPRPPGRASLLAERARLEKMTDALHSAAELLTSQAVELESPASTPVVVPKPLAARTLLGALAGALLGALASIVADLQQKQVTRRRLVTSLGFDDVPIYSLGDTLHVDAAGRPTPKLVGAEAERAWRGVFGAIRSADVRSVAIASATAGAGRSSLIEGLGTACDEAGLKWTAISSGPVGASAAGASLDLVELLEGRQTPAQVAAAAARGTALHLGHLSAVERSDSRAAGVQAALSELLPALRRAGIELVLVEALPNRRHPGWCQAAVAACEGFVMVVDRRSDDMRNLRALARGARKSGRSPLAVLLNRAI